MSQCFLCGGLGWERDHKSAILLADCRVCGGTGRMMEGLERRESVIQEFTPGKPVPARRHDARVRPEKPYSLRKIT